MPDSDLGSAEGRIIITADVGGAVEAGTAMAGVSAEAKTLQAAMGDSQGALADHEKQTLSSSAAIDVLRSKQDGLRQRQQEATEAAKKAVEAEREYGRVILDVSSTVEKRQEAENAVVKSKKDSEQASRTATQAEQTFLRSLSQVNAEYGKRNTTVRQFVKDNKDYIKEVESTVESHHKVDDSLKRNVESFGKFDKAKDNTRRNVQGFRKDIDDLTKTLGSLTHIDTTAQSFKRLTDSIDTVRTASLAALGGGSLLGGAGLLGGGAAEGITALVGSMTQLVGVVGLLPGVVGAAGVSLGVLAVGLNGVQESLASMGDTAKFVQSLKEVSPVMRQALEEIQSFYSSFRGAMNVVQDAFVAPLIDSIKPLIYTYLPLLMNSGSQIASVFGQAGKIFADWLETPETIQTIQGFLNNIAEGFKAALPAVQAFSNAFLTISSVGSGFFKELGTSLATVAKEFNAFISGAAQSGQLQSFIQGGITAFGVLFTNIKNVGEALFNIFSIGNEYGGGFLAMFKDIGQEFLNWTQSAEGIKDIRDFFQEITDAGHALHPILSVIGSSLATLISTFVQLGTATAPGLMSFFTSLEQTLNVLSPVLIASAPAFNIFLTALGQLIQNVAAALGPDLPTFLTNFAIAATQLIGPATQLAGVVGNLFAHLTPADITAIFAVVTVFEQLGKVLPIVTGAMFLFEAVFSPLGLAIGLLVGGLVLLVEHFGSIDGAIDGTIDAFKRLPQTIGGLLDQLVTNAGAWGSNFIHSFLDGIVSAATSVGQVVKDNVVDPIDKLLHPGSPTKEGPLSEGGGTGGWGASLASNFAEGIASGVGPTKEAAQAVAGSAAGGLTYTGAADPRSRGGGSAGGASGSTGTGLAGPVGSGGGDGFTNWVKSVTANMSALSHIGNEFASIVTTTASMSLDAFKIFGKLWQGGVNPLTAPGGFMQGEKPYIPQASLPGTATVPGVPQATQAGGWAGPTPPPNPLTGAIGGAQRPQGFVGPIAPGASGAAPPSATGPASGLASALQRQGFSQEQVRLIQGFSQVEGNNPAGNPTLGFMDSQLGGDSSLQGHVDALSKQFKDRAGVAGAFPAGGTDSQQAAWIATVVGQNGSPSGPDGLAQPPRADYIQRVISAMQGPVGLTDVSSPLPGGPETQNGWPQINQGGLGPAAVGGARLAAGAPSSILGDFAKWFNANIEPVKDSGGFRTAAPGSIDERIRSNHLSGTALDLNPDDFPGYSGGRQSGAPASTHFTPDQIAKIRAQLATYGGAITWGEDFGAGDADPMHYELAHGGPGNASVAAAYNRLGAPPPLQSPPPAPNGGAGNNTGGLSAGNFYRDNYPNAFNRRPTGGNALRDFGILGLGGAGTLGVLRSMQNLRRVNGDILENHARNGTGPFAGDDLGAPSIQGLNIDLSTPTGEAPPGLRFGAFGEGLPPLQGPLVAPGFGPEGIGPRLPGGGFSSFNTGNFFDQQRLGRPPGFSAALGPVEGPALPPEGLQSPPPVANGGGGFGGFLGKALASRTLGILGTGLAVATAPGSLPSSAPQGLQGPGTVAGIAIPGAGLLAGGSAATGIGLGATTGIVGAGVGILGGLSTAFGAATGQEQTPVFNSGPRVGTGVDIKQTPIPVNVAQQGGQAVPAGNAFSTDRLLAGLQAKGQLPAVPPVLAGSPVPAQGQPGSPATGPPGATSVPFSPGAPSGGPAPGQVGQGAVGGAGIGQQNVPGVENGAAPTSSMSGMQVASLGISGAGSIASSVFQSIDSIIQSVGAFGDLVDTVAKVPKNSEQVIGMIKDVQQFIATGAQLAQTTSTVLSTIGSFVGAGASADPSGAAGAVAGGFQAASAIAGLVSEALTTVNAGISLGIDTYHEVSKVAANVFGFTLGGGNTGWLGGNVQMLLNTNTGQVYTYSGDNPLNKNTLNPGFGTAYDHTDANQASTIRNVNVYAGPGETTQTALSNTMWMVNTSPQVISAAGKR